MRIIAGKFKGRSLRTPTGDFIRPTSDRNRESLFNILENLSEFDFTCARALDLFAGTGALGIEALSRGALCGVFVEQAALARGLIRQNIESLVLEGVTRILRRDATRLGSVGRLVPFNLVFADPPYGQGLGERALISALEGGWLTKDALIILEESDKAQLTLPNIFKLVDERHWGHSQIRFYKLCVT